MNAKKLGIAGLLGFFSMMIVGALTFELFYAKHMGAMAQQYSDVLTFPPNMGPAMLGGVFYIFVITYIYDRMGVDSVKSGVITGAWFGAAKWIFIDTQWMAMMPKLFPLDYVVADVAFSAVMYAISGAAIGWALNRFK